MPWAAIVPYGIFQAIMYPLPDLSRATETPVEFVGEAAGVAFRSTFLAKKGDVVGQHAHEYDHATLCGAGRARLWVDGTWREDIERGQAVEIKAGHVHIFQALEDGTQLSCITEIAKLKGA